MLDDFAIRLENVSKVYRLHGSQSDQLIDVLGLQRFGLRPKSAPREFRALTDISLTVPRGHRIGIVGRNGAGKTTLLKLISGNFSPSQGTVEVNGAVQALMSVGLGFHPEYTGRQNVEASLLYSGLPKAAYEEAIDGIMEFCELGEFIDQPFKTYSLGMQARLMFAAATAIRPDILIVDEVLGAGDAYFVAKSRRRVEDLISSGCTMLLVSHSMQQVLELCDEAIWLNEGQIRMRGDSFSVVKAYEEYMHGGGSSLAAARVSNSVEGSSAPSLSHASRFVSSEALLQEPAFLPHRDAPSLPTLSHEDATEMRHVTKGGVSRWQSERGLKVCGFSIVGPKGIDDEIVSMQPAKMVIFLRAEMSATFQCRYGMVVDDLLGHSVLRIYSPKDSFSTQEGEMRRVEMLLNPVQLGPGEYVVGLSILDYTPLETVNQARRYDLVGRTFRLRVALPDSLAAVGAAFFHTAEWSFATEAAVDD